jgi:hypothetical protein
VLEKTPPLMLVDDGNTPELEAVVKPLMLSKLFTLQETVLNKGLPEVLLPMLGFEE